MNLEEYKSALKSMDWWYDYSDDHRVYRAGLYRKQLLEGASNESPEHKLAWDQVQQSLRDGTFRAQPRLTKREDA